MSYLKKKLTDFLTWILVGDSEKSHLDFQREVRERKREKAVTDVTKRKLKLFVSSE